MRKKLFFGASSLFSVAVLFLGTAADGFTKTCTETQVKQKVEKVFLEMFKYPFFGKPDMKQPEMQIKIDSISDFPVGNQVLCEVIFHVEPEKKTNEPVQKFIFYTLEDVVIVGNLWKYDNEKKQYVNLTQEKFMTVNKEYIQHMQEKFKQIQDTKLQNEELKKIAKSEFNNLTKQADVKFETKTAKASVVSFVDPHCPYCKHMKGIIMKKFNEGKINAYFIFLPISKESEEILTSILCDKKTSNERLEAFEKLYKSKNLCETGKKKVKENHEAFAKLMGRGVPLTIVKKGEEVEIIRGFVTENTFDSYIE